MGSASPNDHNHSKLPSPIHKSIISSVLYYFLAPKEATMRLFHILLLCCAIAEAASTMHFTDSWDGIVAGQPFDLTWEDNIGAVNITLNQGTETNCTAVNEIASKTPYSNGIVHTSRTDETQPISIQPPSLGHHHLLCQTTSSSSHSQIRLE